MKKGTKKSLRGFARKRPRGAPIRREAQSAPNGGMPIYQRARELISQRIEGGEYAADQQLPSERDLSQQLGISRMTARHVYVTLQSDGLIYRANRKGWFVSPPRLHYALMRSVSFLSNVRAEGGVPHAKVLGKEMRPATEWLAKMLGVGKAEMIIVVRRLLSIGDRPAMIEMLYMPASRFPGLLGLPLDQSISQLWKERFGIDVARAEATIRGGMLPPEDAVALNVEPTAAAIRLTEKMYDAGDRPIAIDVQHWRSDIAEFTVDVNFNLGGR